MTHGLTLSARIVAGPGKLIEIIEDIAMNRNDEGVAGPAQCFDTKVPIGMQMINVMSVEEVQNLRTDQLYTRMREDFFYPVIKNVLQKAPVARHDTYSMDEYLGFLLTQGSLRFVLASSHIGDLIEGDPDAMARLTAETHSYGCGHFRVLFEGPKDETLLEDMEVLRLTDKMRFNIDPPTVTPHRYDGKDYYTVSVGIGLGLMGGVHKIKLLGP